jgi:PAS domain S-box-containing protein/excisionase family DNA binding protein
MVSALDRPRSEIGASKPAADVQSYYSISQVAALLGVSRVTVSRWIGAGRLPVVRLGHRTVRVRREDLDRLLAEQGPAGSRLWAVNGRSREDDPDDDRAPRADWREIGVAAHFVQFYEADAFLVDVVADYIGSGLRAGEAGIVIATEAHREGLEERWRDDGLDLVAARADGRFVSLDAADTLSRIMVAGEPEPGLFREVVGNVVAGAAQGGRRVRAFGEMVALLVAGENLAGAIHLERLWNDLQKAHEFSLMCAYPMEALGGEAFDAVLGEVRTEHSRVIPAESYAALSTPDERLRAIASLQQKAVALQAEIDARPRREAAALRLAAIVESSDDAIIGKTLDGIIVDWNPGAERIYGYSADEVVGRSISRLIPDNRPDELPAIMERLRRGEHIDHFETERVGKDGRRLNVSVTISPIRDASDRIIGASTVARDITARKQAEREREELLAREQAAREEAETALRLRDEFLSVASHELRTPLTTLSAHAQLALRRLDRDGTLEPERTVQALRTIRGQAEKLSVLLRQLLDVSRLEAGKLALERQPTDLAALVEQVVSDARARSDGHAITLAAPASLEAVVDPLRLEQVLTNLLDNAIKYSPDGGSIEVSVARAAKDALEIAVRDHGLGIPPENREQIFERFFQAHGNGHRSGLGLGLYVSRQITELHGGEIRAEFPPDGGTRFVVRLPLVR